VCGLPALCRTPSRCPSGRHTWAGVLVFFQGCSELLGGPQNGRANKVCPMIHGLQPASVTTFVFVKKPSIAAERSRLACHRMNSSWSITPAACAS